MYKSAAFLWNGILCWIIASFIMRHVWFGGKGINSFPKDTNFDPSSEYSRVTWNQEIRKEVVAVEPRKWKGAKQRKVHSSLHRVIPNILDSDQNFVEGSNLIISLFSQRNLMKQTDVTGQNLSCQFKSLVFKFNSREKRSPLTGTSKSVKCFS